ncbi:hypothetical protein [Actinophytocola algeriensis]|uniref:Uncharacterized protein n=1 Tax=Actinophytocola algeriensis TaxID=1768010 RepID=A0A7W7VFX2_9PSEU|nr:hypothetical protein [Actinophytocola algeriensis]MBB4908534.1 hypothetical protein [Actinophytocola algeriensis]MBE1475079.1 hypothetical protein [Actinophytocola algeriensis]
MSGDEEFGRTVGDRLRDEVAGIYADRDLVRAVRKRSRRRSWTIRASIGAPLVAAAAAAAVLVTTSGSGVTTTDPTPPRGGQAAPPATTTQPRVENLAHVRDMTIQALRSAEHYVIHEKNMLDTGYLEYWTDRATHRYRVDNYSAIVQSEQEVEPGPGDVFTAPPIPDEPPTGPIHRTQSIAGDGPPGDIHYTYVDYERKTWSTSHDTEPPLPLEVPDILDADALKQAIDEGRMELIGAEAIDGKPTHHLRLFATRRGYQIDLWVDSTSYLPVRETSTVIDGPDKPVMTSDYTWLPRTEENLAKLELTPPPDFVRE